MQHLFIGSDKCFLCFVCFAMSVYMHETHCTCAFIHNPQRLYPPPPHPPSFPCAVHAGVNFFGRVDGFDNHFNFSTFGNAMLSLFRISTADAWEELMYTGTPCAPFLLLSRSLLDATLSLSHSLFFPCPFSPSLPLSLPSRCYSLSPPFTRSPAQSLSIPLSRSLALSLSLTYFLLSSRLFSLPPPIR